MSISTLWPYRQALRLCLRNLILTEGVPAVNVDMGRLITDNSARHVSFNDANVIGYDKMDISEPTICIAGGSQHWEKIATGGIYIIYFSTKIMVKTPWVGDSFPEDYALLFDSIADNFGDLLTSRKNSVIHAVNPNTGNSVLKDSQQFNECYLSSAMPMRFPVTSSEGVTRCQGILLTHYAQIPSDQARTGALGG
jgi:hypothetical protein